MADITQSIADSVWYGWGDPALAEPLSEHALAYLTDELRLGSISPTRLPVDLSEVRLGDSRLDERRLALLRDAVGSDAVFTDRTERIRHAGGKSTVDLLRIRAGVAGEAPDAVICPETSEQVADLLRVCAAEKIAVVPFGGGTSVVGGVRATPGRFDAVVSVDLHRLNRMLSLDPVSRTAVFQAGIRGPALEAALADRGFTLGHLPQSHQEASLGGYAATRSAGQSSAGYGRSDELITALRVEAPAGTLRLGGHAPASATGPGLLDLLIGSEGVYGIITEVTVSIVPKPLEKAFGAWSFPSFEAGAEALRELIQGDEHGEVPTVCRLSDVDETDANLRLAGGRSVEYLRRYLQMRGHTHPALGIFVWEGRRGSTAARRRRSARVFRRHGGVAVTASPARAWDRGRFLAPYRRDELLTRGVLVETLETATSWANLHATHRAVHAAITGALEMNGAPCHVQTHISHLYPGGASLYYTFVAGMEGDGIEQCLRVKRAASEAIVVSGAAISHHHAIGSDHAEYLAEQIGALAEDVLGAVKYALDPVGILNPGKLIRLEDGISDATAEVPQ
ncbi:FAD-binding oxidoreductase [Homoserinimonas sp. OAct 916]|uniref:FAD-binding oxidoreductase n=1 Tax=Homoserinimonas sp. OAct 916 TaxID=2211450 RepID=UPI000DBE446E|nr:FAD-binding oxidoreductase [Homoserinimonas sp. OAct 916]